MSPKARRRAAAAAAVLLLAGGALAFGQANGTFAIFTGDTESPNAAAVGSWIPAPSGQASSLDGSPYSQEHLAWTSGNSTVMPGSATNPVTGQAIYYADGGTGGSASCGAYSSFSTTTAAATTADLTGTQLSDWWCFEVYSTSSGANTSGVWTSPAVTFAAQRLFTPINTVVLTNGGGTSGSIEKLDTIAITFNQAPSNPGTITVSTNSVTGTITIGSVGTISGLTIGANKTYDASTSNVAGSTLTITIGATTNGITAHATTVSGLPGTFTGGGFTASGGTHLCTAAACTVATSGSF